MPQKLTQPKINQYLHWLHGYEYFGEYGCIYDEKSNILLNELFTLLDQIAPVSPQGVKTLWFRAERGPIEDFGNMEEEIAEGNYSSEQEFKEAWTEEFPNEIEWYHFSAVEDEEEGFRAVMIHHDYVIVQDDRRKPSGFPLDISEFAQWIVDAVKECLLLLWQDKYNAFVRENLPPQHRTGTILRKDLWKVWPDAKEEFFKDISPVAIATFIRTVAKNQSGKAKIQGRLTSITANDFYRFCARGYAANKYTGLDRTPKEQYLLHADGRDEGLRDIDPDDPEAFRAWLHNRPRGGHPWEVCRGGNSTHISLYVAEDEKGFYLYLSGSAWSRTIETVKFYLALTLANVPVFLREAETLVKRLTGDEKIGIVPDGVFPAYCSNRFPEEHIVDFINLPVEDREAFLPYCVWQAEDPVVTVSSWKDVVAKVKKELHARKNMDTDIGYVSVDEVIDLLSSADSYLQDDRNRPQG